MEGLTKNTIKNPQQPLVVQIENTAYCNRRCPWCPQSKMEFRSDQKMSWEVLEKIVDDLVEMKFVNRIHPYGNGEPLTDPELAEKVRYIRKRLPDCHQYIATNGDFVDKVYSFEELFEAGMSGIQCNHYDDNNQKLKEYKDDRIEHYNIGDLYPTFYNRAGNIRMTSMTPSKYCWFPGRKLYFNYLGDMLVCCADWQFIDPIGNIKHHSIPYLLSLQKVKRYQEYLENNRSSELPLCSKCNQIKQTQEGI